MKNTTMVKTITNHINNKCVFKFKKVETINEKEYIEEIVYFDDFYNKSDKKEITIIKDLSRKLTNKLDKQIIETLFNCKNKKIIDSNFSNLENEYSEFLFKVRKAKYENKKVLVNLEYSNHIAKQIDNIDEFYYIIENTDIVDTKDFSYMIVNDLIDNILIDDIKITKEIEPYSIIYKSYVNISILNLNYNVEIKEYINLKEQIKKQRKNIL